MNRSIEYKEGQEDECTKRNKGKRSCIQEAKQRKEAATISKDTARKRRGGCWVPGVGPLSLGFLAGHSFGLSQDAMSHCPSTPTPLLKRLQSNFA